MNLSVNKPAKAFLQGEFQKSYSDQTMQQLDNPTTGFSTAELNPVDLSMAVMKMITGQWLVKVRLHKQQPRLHSQWISLLWHQ